MRNVRRTKKIEQKKVRKGKKYCVHINKYRGEMSWCKVGQFLKLSERTAISEK